MTFRYRARADSDFDIGILPSRAIALREELSLGADLSVLLGAEVDLVSLDRDETLLDREVARTRGAYLSFFPGFLDIPRNRHFEMDRLRRDARASSGALPRETRDGIVTNAPLVVRKLAVLSDHVQRIRARRPESVEARRADLPTQLGAGGAHLLQQTQMR